MKNRNYSMDYLKIISIICIVLFHYFWNAKYSWAQFTYPQRVTVDIFLMLGELGVNCFALISGYFLSASKKPFKISKLAALWGQVFLYSLLSAAVIHQYVKPYTFSIPTMLSIVFPVTYNVWWYTSAYVLLYIFSPYLNRCLTNLSRNEYRRLVIVLVGIFSIIPTILGAFSKNTESFLYYNRFLWLVVLYCVGGYFQLHGDSLQPTFNNKPVSKPLFWFLVHVATWILLIGYIAVMEYWPDLLGKAVIMDAIYFWRPNSFLMLVLSVSLFMFFAEINLPGGRIVSFLASTTLGIYMTHGGRSAAFWWNRIFHNPEYAGTWNVFTDAFTALLTIFCVGVVIEIIRQSLAKFVTWMIDSLKAPDSDASV